MKKPQIIIIGAGPAGLMAAQQLALKDFDVHVYEQNKAAARKFLVAGKGGFNLTHSEDVGKFIENYDCAEIQNIVKMFDNKMVVQWLESIGISTYVGSSGKVFPTKNFKPIQVLDAWLAYLKKLDITIHYQYTFKDFDADFVYLQHQANEVKLKYEKLILGMGGGSWSKTGSDAHWVNILRKKNIEINPLQAANSGYNTAALFPHLAGQYLKNIQVSFEDHHKIGEVVFTAYGIEGSPVYFMNRFTRKHRFPITLYIDLKPNLDKKDIEAALKKNGAINSILKSKLKLSATAILLLKTIDKTVYTNAALLAKYIKAFPIEALSFRPIDEVISTAGGIAFSELNSNLELKDWPNIYCVGEMVDWEAPTGGYLLQACFSMGYWVAAEIDF